MMDQAVVFLTDKFSLKGKVEHGQNNRNVYSFLGVPYAVPPIRKLRFKRPLQLHPIDGQHDATQFGML